MQKGKIEICSISPMEIEIIFNDSVFPGPLVVKNIKHNDFFLDILPRDQLKLIFILRNKEPRKNVFLATTYYKTKSWRYIWSSILSKNASIIMPW